MAIRLVVGLGNPGPSYAATRHNIGRRVVESLALDKPAGLHLLCPEEFMNNSGVEVARVSRKKGIRPDEILVVSDDFELPLGRLRIRPQGSSGGHNGLKSIFEHLGTQAIPRVRVGIGPVPPETDPADFVLKSFSSSERKGVEEAVVQAAEAVRVISLEGIEAGMNRFNKKAENPQ